jgi:hypothetical protein
MHQGTDVVSTFPSTIPSLNDTSKGLANASRTLLGKDEDEQEHEQEQDGQLRSSSTSVSTVGTYLSHSTAGTTYGRARVGTGGTTLRRVSINLDLGLDDIDDHDVDPTAAMNVNATTTASIITSETAAGAGSGSIPLSPSERNDSKGDNVSSQTDVVPPQSPSFLSRLTTTLRSKVSSGVTGSVPAGSGASTSSQQSSLSTPSTKKKALGQRTNPSSSAKNNINNNNNSGPSGKTRGYWK